MGRPSTPIARRRAVVKPTSQRRGYGAGHFPPVSGVGHDGMPWKGCSRIIDRPARRRANRRTWAALKAESRRAFVARQRAAAPDPDLLIDELERRGGLVARAKGVLGGAS